MWPLPGDRTYWVLTVRGADPGDGSSAIPAAEEFSDAFTAEVPPAGALLDHTRDVLRTPIFDRDPVTRWHGERVVLIGDAAHPMQPTTGQGAGQALIDALALATEIDRARTTGEDPRTALEWYAALRGPQTAAAVLDARQIAALHHMPGAPARGVRDLVMGATPHRIWQRRAEPPAGERELVETAARRLAHQGAYKWSDTR
jgi:2-polyprenyl-6-methoxyphenol hydroxylase-like FAD-dependent oxidoreductase